jgi:hypothetical protein
VLEAESSVKSEPLIFFQDDELNAKSEEIFLISGTLRNQKVSIE